MRRVPAVARWFGRSRGSDPGHVRLFASTATVTTILAVVLAKDLFVSVTHALLRPVPLHNFRLAASVTTLNNDLTIVAMLLGALVVFASSLNLDEQSRPKVLIALLYPPIPLLLTIAFGLGLSHFRWLELLGMSVFLGVGTLGRRLGSRGSSLGLVSYVGVFFGFFLSSIVSVRALGWLSCEVVLALAITALMRTTIFFRSPEQKFRSMSNGFEVRARLVAVAALKVLQEPTPKSYQQLQRNTVALNEAGLMVESALGVAESSVRGSVSVLRQSLFDLELSLSNIARFVARLGRLEIDPEAREDLTALLHDIAASEDRTLRTDRTLLVERFRSADPDLSKEDSMIRRRLADSLDHYLDALSRLRREAAVPHFQDEHGFTSPVVLRGGFLPGSSEVSAHVSELSKSSSILHRGLRPEVRAAIQITLASALAIVVGDALDPQRFYWAPLAALLCFMGANTAAEQVIKGLNRVVGTIAGIVVGYAIVVGLRPHGLLIGAMMLIFLFLGLYLLRVSYLFMAFGVTVALSLLYSALSELTAQLLVIRLEETMAGAASAIVVALVVVPLSSRRVFDFAVVRFVNDGGRYIAALADRVPPGDLVDLARRVDADFQTLRTVGRSMRGFGVGIHLDTSERLIGRSYALSNYLQMLSEDLHRIQFSSLAEDMAMREGLLHLARSFVLVAKALQGRVDAPYERSAHLFEAIRDDRALASGDGVSKEVGEDDSVVVLSDLMLIDGALAALADVVKVEFLGARDDAPSANLRS